MYMRERERETNVGCGCEWPPGILPCAAEPLLLRGELDQKKRVHTQEKVVHRYERERCESGTLPQYMR